MSRLVGANTLPRVDPLKGIIVLRVFVMAIILLNRICDSRDPLSRTLNVLLGSMLV